MKTTDKIETLSKSLTEACLRFSRSLHGSFHRGHGHGPGFGHGQKPAEFFVLTMLLRGRPGQAQENLDSPGLRVSDIAASLGVTASSVTQIVTELETKGLVDRRMDAQDRRVVRVSLTDKGRGLLEEARHPYVERMTELALHLGSEKAQVLIDLLMEVESFLLKNQTGPSGFSIGCPGEDPKENQAR